MKLSWVLGLWCALATAPPAATNEGQELYEAACASCHGLDGRGAPQGTAINVPLPDFTDCSFVTREATGNWVALAAHGGQELALSPQMPGFGDALSEAQIRSIIAYLRRFCTDPFWPSADLNFRRPLFTGKAFPEDELVLNYNFERSRRLRSLVNEWTLEKRFGARRMAEVTLPFVYHDPQGSATTGGGGGIPPFYKHVLFACQQNGIGARVSIHLMLATRDRGPRL